MEPTARATATPLPTPVVDPTPAPVTLQGQVISAVDGVPLADAKVSANGLFTTSGDDGVFGLEGVEPGSRVVVERPAWQPVSADWPSGLEQLVVELSPRIVKGLRVSQETAADAERFEALLSLAEGTVANTLVFDTKDEADQVLYETGVALANEMDAVNAVYEPADLLAQAKERNLYTITRIVTFEDSIWASAPSDATLTERWLDASNEANWDYPLALAVEACELGFDEVQFDYVRFPSGEAAAEARDLVPAKQRRRTNAIAGFLDEARSELHARGCAVSAAVFGIVMSSVTDERLGQTAETVSAVVDAVSPMVYPSHYGPGWLGFSDPNEHPARVVGYALDQGSARMASGSLVRPWLQGFSYCRKEVRAQIDEADERGMGWIIWNYDGNYGRKWLPES